ncbi:hypothetical protein ACYSNO_01370 [Enterococcus sp. LJL98]
MDAIDVIIEKINAQATNERQEYKKSRLAEIETRFLVEKRQVLKEHESQLARQLEQVTKQAQQRKNRLTIEARQDSLKTKQSYLTRLFDEVYEQMTRWDIEETRQFAFHILEKLDLKEGILIPGGAMSPDIFTTEWLRETEKALQVTLALGERSRVLEYGFLIENQGVQYNFFYRDLLLEERKMKGHALMDALFS